MSTIDVSNTATEAMAAQLTAKEFKALPDDCGQCFEYRAGYNLVRVEQEPGGWWVYRARVRGFMVAVSGEKHAAELAEIVPFALDMVAQVSAALRVFGRVGASYIASPSEVRSA